MPFRRTIDRFRLTTRALRHRNFRLFLFGQSVSLVGTMMQRIAMAWLVWRITDSPWMLGLIGFCSQAPTLVLGPIAGMAADRLDRYKVLLAMQSLAMLQASILATLVLGGVVQVWHLVALSLALGAITTFEVPARQALVIRLIDDRADLGNAIALHSSAFNAARLVGPSVAGLLIAWLGEGPVFLINAVSFVAVLGALLALRIERPAPRPLDGGIARHLAEGFRYAFGTPSIRAILLLLGLISLAGMPYAVLMPVLADRVYNVGVDGLGFMLGVAGGGALAGALILASRRSATGLNRRVPIAAVAFSLSLLALGFAPPWPVALALLASVGLCGIYQVAGSNTILQTLVEETQRGRVMSYFSMAVLGMMPLGNLMAGALAQRLGAPATLAVCGACCLLASLTLGRAYGRVHLPPTMRGTPDPARPSEA
jgi:MFS family permease